MYYLIFDWNLPFPSPWRSFKLLPAMKLRPHWIVASLTAIALTASARDLSMKVLLPEDISSDEHFAFIISNSMMADTARFSVTVTPKKSFQLLATDAVVWWLDHTSRVSVISLNDQSEEKGKIYHYTFEIPTNDLALSQFVFRYSDRTNHLGSNDPANDISFCPKFFAETNGSYTNDPSYPLYKYVAQEGNYKVQTQRFLGRVKTRTTPQELQRWAASVLKTHKDDVESPIPHLSPGEIPDFIRKLDPPDAPRVLVGQDSLTIGWGGGFGHWGLFVGTTNSPLPDNPNIYWIEWAPGVQAFHDLQ
jgi:hypothetical protein